MTDEPVTANPYHAPTTVDAPAAAIPRTSVLQWLLRLYPVALFSSFYVTWLVGWVILGHAPRPSLDDPSSIGPAVSLIYWISGLLLIAFPAGLVLGIVWELTHGRSIPKRLLSACAMIALWAVAIMGLRWDPLDVVTWWFD